MQIIVETLYRKKVAFQVDGSDTIDRVRAFIKDTQGIPINLQRYIFAGRRIEEGRPLTQLNIKEGSSIYMILMGLKGGLSIKIKTLTGREIQINIDPTDTFDRIKEMIEEEEGIPRTQQRLIFQGKQLADDKTVKDYNIDGGTVLHLVLALRGGH